MLTPNVANGPRRLRALEKRLLVPAAVAAALAFTLPTHAQDPVSSSSDIRIAQATPPGTVTNAPAAAAKPADQLEEIVVTGSHIKRRDYESQSPIVTVNADVFQNKSSVAIESTLNQLPQFKPSGSQSALSPAQNPFPSATATQGARDAGSARPGTQPYPGAD